MSLRQSAESFKGNMRSINVDKRRGRGRDEKLAVHTLFAVIVVDYRLSAFAELVMSEDVQQKDAQKVPQHLYLLVLKTVF